jgi:2-hydroxy-6-oxonona-2,4-dienedioate hydrolase
VQADAYIPLLDHLRVGETVVVGISAGVWSAIEFAARHRERCRALVLVVPADTLPEGTSVYGGSATKAIIGSDFVTWAVARLMPLLPGMVAGIMFGTNPDVVRGAAPAERARLIALMRDLLPMSARSTGMQFDLETAAVRKPEPLALITCPVLTISAEDDRFGTARRAGAIAAAVVDGRAIVYPTGGHALVGRQEEVRRDVMVFLEEVRTGERRP